MSVLSTAKKKPACTGLSISHERIELAVFSPEQLSIQQSCSVPLPIGLFDTERDTIQDIAIFKGLLTQAFKQIPHKPTMVHLSIPATMLRKVEMPKMEMSSLYLALSSEAERYTAFEETDASVDFVTLQNPDSMSEILPLVLGAVRNDALLLYLKILKEFKIKVGSVSLEPLNVLRGLGGTGVLDSLVQQIGMDAHWGIIFIEAYRVRFLLWQGNTLLELRELSMDTRGFGQDPPDVLAVEDMLSEIRRTARNGQPALWFTHRMPLEMIHALSASLECPLHEALVGNSVGMSQPLQLATLGCAMSDVVQFPFELDLLKGLRANTAITGGGSSHGASNAQPDKEEGSSSVSTAGLIPIGILAFLLSGIVSVGLFLMGSFSGQQLPTLQTRVDTVRVELVGIQARASVLRKKVELDKTLLQMIERAKLRNHIYVALTDDLKRKTPLKIWIQTLKVDDQLEIMGKALDHESVLYFAKSFDSSPYTKAILIDSIREDTWGKTALYDFKISGGINMDPSILTIPATSPVSSEVKKDPKTGAW